MLEVLCKPRGSVWFFVHPIILFGFICFLLYIVHQVGSPPSCRSWIHSLHWLSTSRSNEDPPSLLFPWWEPNYISWCHSKCFCLHCERHGVSCFTWTNWCPFVTFLLVFLLISWNCVIGWYIRTWPILSLLIPPNKTWFCMLLHFIWWLWQWRLKQKDFTMINIRHMCFFPLP
jgi:hypothetical protein